MTPSCVHCSQEKGLREVLMDKAETNAVEVIIVTCAKQINGNIIIIINNNNDHHLVVVTIIIVVVESDKQ
jgi:hypothetical protein